MWWDKFKNFVKKTREISTSVDNLTAYPDLTASLKEISDKMNQMSSSLDSNKQDLKDLSHKMDDFDKELVKIKDGLQMELFSSLQLLHQRLKAQRYATVEDKMEAKRYYDQIHNLGKDGWSQKYYDEIIDLPESKADYYKNLNSN